MEGDTLDDEKTEFVTTVAIITRRLRKGKSYDDFWSSRIVGGPARLPAGPLVRGAAGMRLGGASGRGRGWSSISRSSNIMSTDDGFTYARHERRHRELVIENMMKA